MSKERELLERIVDYAYEYLEIDMDFIPLIQKVLAQPEQKPTTRHALDSYWNQEAYQRGYAEAELKLKRERLSDEEVRAKYRDIALDNPLYVPSYYAGFRDAERIHGIGGR